MNLYLIGYRGCGKSTVAPLVAKAIGSNSNHWESFDADDLLEAAVQMSISRIFAEYGESDFRRRETEIISGLAGRSNLVVSLGGGAPMFAANRELMAGSGKTIWLQADANLLWQRISQDQANLEQRPNLTDQGGREEVVQLVGKRNPVYKGCADYTIEVGGLSPEEITDRIVNWFENVDKQ
jgi:shikimate kinase